MGVFKKYYQLTKPGIIYGNLITATAGFLLASKGHIHVWLLLATLGGIGTIIGSACVFNNYIDRGIDVKMKRTSKRALVTGLIPTTHALIFAFLLGMFGLLLLVVYLNLLTVLLGTIAFVDYVALYGLAKRRSVHSTLVGSVAGAMPITAGYTAVTNRFDSGAILLFLVLTCWQMPHFYAIAMYRFKDYKAAGLPVLPVKKGMRQTKIQILIYTATFVFATALLSVYGLTGYCYLIVMFVVGGVWLWRGLQGFKAPDDARWARKMFGFSLIVLLVFSVMISVNVWLP